MRRHTDTDDDLPFGIREDKSRGRTSKPVIVGLVAVTLCVAIGAGVAYAGSLPANGGGYQVTFTNQCTSNQTGNNSGIGNGSTEATGGNVSANSSANTAATGTSASQASGTDVCVHVVGCVANPGVVRLACGSRIADAVAAAGGLTSDAAADGTNLAQIVQDGQQIRILSVEEAAAQAASSTQTTTTTSAGSGSTGSTGNASSSGGSGSSSSTGGSSGKVNINTATSEELQKVSGIGEATARKILADRETNGPFASVDDLTRVSGIGEKKLAAFRDQLTV